LENATAVLEEARFCSVFASGQAAINAILQLLDQGDHVLAVRDIDDGAYRQFTKVIAALGISVSFVDTTNLDNIRDGFLPNTKLLWLKSPNIPQVSITDIVGSAALAKERGVISVVDSTFASPYLQNPLALGADLVIHSNIKYIAGYSGVPFGLVLTNDLDTYERLRSYQNTIGAKPNPQECLQVLSGLKTLGVRMERHCFNTLAVAKFLESHPRIARVHYPGLVNDPGYEIAKKQMRAFGAIISFELRGTFVDARSLLTRLRLFVIAEGLRDVKSLIYHRMSITHGAVEPEISSEAGIADGLIRASIGLEDFEDLIDDLKDALG